MLNGIVVVVSIRNGKLVRNGSFWGWSWEIVSSFVR